MRNDMHKVIIDLPRGGSSARNRKSRLRMRGNQVNSWTSEQIEDHDDGPKRFSMSMSGRNRDGSYDSKEFSDRLNPLRRFLRSQVGRSWNDVYSEMSSTVDNRTMVGGYHFWIHVFQYVELECYVREDGKVYSSFSYNGRRSEITGFFVHPTTGILCYREANYDFSWKKKDRFEQRLIGFGFSQFGYWENKDKKADVSLFRIVSDEVVLEKKKGSWFIHNIAVHKTSDVVSHDWVYTDGIPARVPVYWKKQRGVSPYYVASSRQLGKKDLRKYREVINGNPF